MLKVEEDTQRLIGKKLDPDNEALLLNLAAYYMNIKDRISARKYLEQVIGINPANRKAKLALEQLRS